MKRKSPPLSKFHLRILKRLHLGTFETPDTLSTYLVGRHRTHDDQQRAYLQLSRLMARGYVRRPKRATYIITAKGRAALEG